MLTKKLLLSLCFLTAVCSAAELGVFESTTDVGVTPKKGSDDFNPATGEYRVTGGGANMWTDTDAFHFVWKKVSGDVALTADVQFVGKGAVAHRKMAVLVRQNLEPGSAYADAVVHGDGLTSLQYRSAAGGQTVGANATQTPLDGVRRIRIERRGNVFTMLAGTPGDELKPAGPATVVLQDPVYIGLGVCSHDADILETAIFSNVKIESLRPRILGMAHIAVYAKDFEKSRAYYRDFLGFEEPYSLPKPDGTPAMTFFKVNERQYIELFPETAANTGRLSHISIETDNAEAMRLYLESRGVAVPKSVPKGRIGNSNFNVKDPDGHTVEIVQYEPDGWTVRERGKHLPESRVSKRIMHVAIIVTALEPAMKFYRDILGFSETWRGSSSGTQLSWVNLKVPEGEDYIEFMLYKDAPPPDRRGVAHHFALEVPDMAASVAALQAKPYNEEYSRPIETRTGISRKRQANLFDPDGTRAELMEPVTVDGKPAPSSQAPPPN